MCTSWLCSKRQSVVGNMRYAKLKLTFSFEEQKLSSLSVLFCGEGSMLSSKIRELLRWARVVFKVTKSVLSYLNHSIDVMLTQFESKILFKKTNSEFVLILKNVNLRFLVKNETEEKRFYDCFNLKSFQLKSWVCWSSLTLNKIQLLS